MEGLYTPQTFGIDTRNGLDKPNMVDIVISYGMKGHSNFGGHLYNHM